MTNEETVQYLRFILTKFKTPFYTPKDVTVLACSNCVKETLHVVENKVMEGNKLYRKGFCIECSPGQARALSHAEPLGEFKIPFGKHKNKTFNEIYEEDPDYLRWAAINLHAENIREKIENYLEEHD